MSHIQAHADDADTKQGKNDTTSSSMIRIVRSEAETSAPYVRVSGVSAYKKYVELKARLTRTVASVDAKEGSSVPAGALLVSLASENIQADLAEAKATLKQRREDYQAFSALFRTKDVAKKTVSQASAALKQAEARLSMLQQDKNFLRVKAPFAAYVNRLPVREGDVVTQNQTILAQLFDPSSFIVTADIPERLLSRIDRDKLIKAHGVDGSSYEARISFIGAQADSMTRTFPLEARVSKPESNNILPAGVTFTLMLPLKNSHTHYIPASALALDDDGRIGVKVKENNKALFYPIRMIDSGSEDGHIHIDGLPDVADIIMVGHAYVKEGADLSDTELNQPF